MNIRILTLFLFVHTALNHPRAQSHQDFEDAFPICTMGTYLFDDMTGFGKVQTSDQNYPCFLGKFKEQNSKILRFMVQEPGSLSFTIYPDFPEDDLDFILFKQNASDLPGQVIRCMASGESIGDRSRSLPCMGPTGLREEAKDELESTGCGPKDDNFLKALEAKKGDSYYLLVHNYHGGNGFNIHFGGTAILKEQASCPMTTHLDEQIVLNTSLHPNPASNYLNLTFDSSQDGPCQIEIVDLLGTVHLGQDIYGLHGTQEVSLDIQDLPAGSYFLKLKQGLAVSSLPFFKF